MEAFAVPCSGGQAVGLAGWEASTPTCRNCISKEMAVRCGGEGPCPVASILPALHRWEEVSF